jgi:NAD(P)-dependent dehydrogenase (short-subunit alcohol dehydrogenase family)
MKNHKADECSLTGQTVLIVGGTSGIGLATAIQAKQAGAEVIVLGSNPERARRAAEEHGLAGWRAADVTVPAQIHQALADVPEINHLVILAGSFVVAKVLEGDPALLFRPFEERVRAAIHILQALRSKLAARASVTLASGTLGPRPTGAGTATFSAALAAMEALGRGLALELAPRRVNTIMPGPFDTPLFDKVLGTGRQEYLESLAAKIPVGRVGAPAEAARAILFLITNEFVTGTTLRIDGGITLV